MFISLLQCRDGSHAIVPHSQEARMAREGFEDELAVAYWRGVAQALREVFGADETLAEPLHEKVECAPPEVQEVFYAMAPSAIAGDLARALYLRN